MNLIYLLDGVTVDTSGFCSTFAPTIKVFGVVYWFIKVGTPITLLVVGMYQATKAIASKDEESIRKAWRSLGKKAIAAVSIFLVATIVGVVMEIAGGTPNELCTKCFNHPFDSTCNIGGTGTDPFTGTKTRCGEIFGTCDNGYTCKQIAGEKYYQCVKK